MLKADDYFNMYDHEAAPAVSGAQESEGRHDNRG